MTEETQPGPARRRRRARRERSATESLTSIALVLEAIVLFFASLVVFALRILPALPAFAGGAAFIVLLALVASATRHPWALALAWVLQAALIALGLLVPEMWVVGAAFAALFAFCFFTGRRLDRRKTKPPTDLEEPK